MHARELVEIAGLVSFHSDSLVKASSELCDDAMAEYWIASRCRLDHWGRSLRSLANSETIPIDLDKDVLLKLGEEIVLSGIHTRILTAISFAHDSYHDRQEATSIARNLLDGHREAQTRFFHLIQAWWPRDSAKARHLVCLSLQAEQWADIFLAYIGRTVNVDRWAYDVTRVREFGYDVSHHTRRTSNVAWDLLSHSIHTNFAVAKNGSFQPELNRRIAGATLSLFSTELFDSYGLMQSPWMLRVERSTEETMGMLEKMLVEEEPPTFTRETTPRWQTEN